MRSSRAVRGLGAALVVAAITLAAFGASGALGPASDRSRVEFGDAADTASELAVTEDDGSGEAPARTQAEEQADAPTVGDLDADVYAAPPVSPYSTTAPRGAIDTTRWPVRVDVPALNVSAPVQPVGVGAERELIIPSSPMDVGWFQGGSVPGESGVALLTSHVDTREEGRGVFAGLVELEAGDRITVTAADGEIQHWTVVARTQHRKDELPAELFSRTGTAQLALVTCGGPFDRSTRSYRDNVIVWAERED